MTEFEFDRVLSAVGAAVALSPPEQDTTACFAALEMPEAANDNGAASPRIALARLAQDDLKLIQDR